MENASKALIIAGAILLSILIIGLGMMIFNQARDAISGSGLETEKATTFNSKFLEYTGNSVKKTDLISLIDLVISNDGTYKTTGYPLISITYSGTTYKSTATLSTLRNTISAATATKKFKVTPTKYDASGYITTITVE